MRNKPITESPNSSRSAKKRALEITQALAKELMDLNDGEFESLVLEPEFREQVEFARNIKSHGARRRQLRFLANYVANNDHEAVQVAMTKLRAGKRADADHFKSLESYREKLLAGDEKTAEEIALLLPQCEAKKLRKLQINAQKELIEGKVIIASRALFRYMRQSFDSK